MVTAKLVKDYNSTACVHMGLRRGVKTRMDVHPRHDIEQLLGIKIRKGTQEPPTFDVA
jgi:hypothetical protein